MPYLETPGRPRLYYELDDYTDPWRNAPFIILQHGFSRSSRFWYSWVPYLSRSRSLTVSGHTGGQ